MERIQRNIATAFLRERNILDVAAIAMRDRPDIRILSFGCSIGDELATLRVLFPQAEIHGCDIDEAALARAQDSVGHLAGIFLSDETEILRRGPYDLICAFSSLCIHPFRSEEETIRIFPFARFETMIGLFHDCLTDGGMLATRNMNYVLADTRYGPAFSTLRSNAIIRSGFVPILRPDGRLIFNALHAPAGPVHFIQDRSTARDAMLVDCLFRKRAGAEARIDLDLGVLADPEVTHVKTAAWQRSNLDTLAPAQRTGAVEFVTRFRTFTPREPGGMTYLEQTIRRRSIDRPGEWVEASRAGFYLPALAQLPD